MINGIIHSVKDEGAGESRSHCRVSKNDGCLTLRLSIRQTAQPALAEGPQKSVGQCWLAANRKERAKTTPIFLLLSAAGIGLRAFYGALRPMPAYAVCVSRAAMQEVSIFLSVFRTRSPVKIFWSKIGFFPLLPCIFIDSEICLCITLLQA